MQASTNKQGPGYGVASPDPAAGGGWAGSEGGDAQADFILEGIDDLIEAQS